MSISTWAATPDLLPSLTTCPRKSPSQSQRMNSRGLQDSMARSTRQVPRTKGKSVFLFLMHYETPRPRFAPQNGLRKATVPLSIGGTGARWGTRLDDGCWIEGAESGETRTQ